MLKVLILLFIPYLLLCKDVDTYVQKQIEKLDIPTLSLLIIENNKEAVLKTYNKDKTTSLNNPNFVIGSLTKSFTALAIMQLIEQKKINLNDPIKKHLPFFEVKNSDDTKLITIKNLLNHSSGFSTYEGLKNFSKNTTIEDDVKALKNTILASKPNEKFIYSNINYQILGLIIEKASNLTYPQYLKKNIFEPLEMNNTTTLKSESKNLAKGHRTWFGVSVQENFESNKSMLPAGYIISNIEDMSKYLRMILNEGIYKGKTIISKESFKNILNEAFPIVKDNLFYSFGWFISDDKYGLKFNHTGAVENYMSFVIIDPIKKDAILVLQNKMTFTLDSTEMNKLALNIMLKYKGLNINDISFHMNEFLGYILLPFLFFLQLFFIVKFIKKVKQNKSEKVSVLKRFILPIVFDIIVIAFLLVLPSFFNLNLSGFRLFVPDLAYMLYSVIFITFLGMILRTLYIMKDSNEVILDKNY